MSSHYNVKSKDLGNELAAAARAPDLFSNPKRANNINLADDLTRRCSREKEEEEAEALSDANQSST